MRENWQAVKYAISLNAFCLFWIIILYGELNFWPVLPIGLFVLFLIDFLYWRAQQVGHAKKPNLSLYACAAIFLLGALSAPFWIIKEHISLWASIGSLPAAFVGLYSLRTALRIQRHHPSAH